VAAVFFALGICNWLYNHSIEPMLRYLADKFKNKPVSANTLSTKAAYAEKLYAADDEFVLTIGHLGQIPIER
jgi:hypothetical protein